MAVVGGKLLAIIDKQKARQEVCSNIQLTSNMPNSDINASVQNNLNERGMQKLVGLMKSCNLAERYR